MHCEAVTTGTCCGSMKRHPTISECKCIPKGPFLQGKTELVEPTGGAFLLSKCHGLMAHWRGGERVEKSLLELMAYESVANCMVALAVLL